MDAAALTTLAGLPEVVSIEEDVPVPADLASGIAAIAADRAWAAGYTGKAQTIAILDTGVDRSHSFFSVLDNKSFQEFSRFDDRGGANTCSTFGLSSPCELTYTSNQIKGLEHVYALRDQFAIAAMNMSLGGGRYFVACNGDARKAIIDNLCARQGLLPRLRQATPVTASTFRSLSNKWFGGR